MKPLTVEARQLANALKKIAPALQSRNTIPILSHVMVTPQDGALSIAATDLDAEAWVTCPAEDTTGAKAFCVMPGPIAKLLNLLGSERVTLTLNGGDLDLTWAGGRARFATLPAGDFPVMRSDKERLSAELPAAFVGDVLAKVRPGISREETRYYLNGVCLDGRQGEARAVSTDGHRLFITDAGDALKPVLKGRNLIAPRHFVALWEALFRGEAATFTAYGDSHIEVTAPGLRIFGKVIDGSYPDWVRVIPTNTKRVFEAPRAAFGIAVARAAALNFFRQEQATFVIDGGLSIERSLPGVGKMLIGVEGAVSEAAEPVGFNLRYIREALAFTKGATIRLEQADSTSPALLVGSEDEPGSQTVLMPFRVHERAFSDKPGLRVAA